MRFVKKLEIIAFIAVLLVLGVHSTELAFHADTIIYGALQAVFALLFFIYAIFCIEHLIMREIQDKYFTEFPDKSNHKLIKELKERNEEE